MIQVKVKDLFKSDNLLHPKETSIVNSKETKNKSTCIILAEKNSDSNGKRMLIARLFKIKQRYI